MQWYSEGGRRGGSWGVEALCLLEGIIVANRKGRSKDPLHKLESSKLIESWSCDSYELEQNAVSGKTKRGSSHTLADRVKPDTTDSVFPHCSKQVLCFPCPFLKGQ